jgi:hypothetical protein
MIRARDKNGVAHSINLLDAFGPRGKLKQNLEKSVSNPFSS